MFDGIIGNDKAKVMLRRLVKDRRVPNSLLFAGDDGIGKRLFAASVAKAFLCREPVAGEPCGACSACRRADVLEAPKSEKKEDFERVIFSDHPDLGMVLPFKRNLLVKAVRDLEREANFRPYEAAARFFIIDDADKMNDAAANALLKTLEEPAQTTHIILISSRPDSLLPTIRSRVQTIRFAPVPTAEVEDLLTKDKAFSRDEAKLAASASRGSVSRAVSMNIREFRAARERMLEVIRSVLQRGDQATALKVSEEMSDAKNKERFEENLDILESLIRDLWLLAKTGDEDRMLNGDLVEELRSMTGRIGGHDLAGWLAEIETMRSNFIVNINRKVATDALFVGMAQG